MVSLSRFASPAKIAPLVALGLLAVALPALAQTTEPATAPVDPMTALATKAADLTVAADTAWVLIAGMLVFFMNLGFAMVESGLCRQKNCVNILAKNFIVFACASLAYLVLGWGLMFGNGNGFFGTEGLWFVSGADNSPATGSAYAGAYSAIAWTGVPLWTKFFFQLVFAGTAATIVSGAVAERIKFGSFVIFSFVLCGVIYPIIGHLIWGGGWLSAQGMFDFAGSSVVHSCGGWAALAGVIVLGPRIGKYKDGKVHPIPGHSMTSVTLGGLVLWFGWFGFNPGSTMAIVGYADSVGHIAVTTNTAAAAATITSAITAWLLLGKPDLSMIINGTLAGLVAITAPCAFVSVGASLLIGAVSGVLVVFAVLMFDKLKLDDPVGALSVHLIHGVLGTICVGLFAQQGICSAAATIKNGLFYGGGVEQLMPQLYGVVLVAVITFVGSMITWVILKAAVGIRVTEKEEIEGLDIGEHGQEAYPDFAGRTGN